MALPNPGMDAVPFTPITSQWGDEIIENIEALAAGSGLDDGVLDNTKLKTGSGIAYRLGRDIKTSVGTVIPNAYTTYCTVNASSLNKEVEIEYGVQLRDGSSGASRTGHIRIQVDGVTLTGSDLIWQTPASGVYISGPQMIIAHTPSDGAHTWTLQVQADTASASILNQAYMKVNQYP